MRVFPLGLLVIIIFEFWLVAIVATHLGALLTLLLFISTTFVGLSLLRHQARDLIAQTTGALQQRESIKDLFSASKIMIGGVLLIIPGFLTDALGLSFIALGLLRRLHAGSTPAPKMNRYHDSPFQSKDRRQSSQEHEVIEGEFTREDTHKPD